MGFESTADVDEGIVRGDVRQPSQPLDCSSAVETQSLVEWG